MKINILNLKNEIKKLNKLINEYEEVFLNLYNDLSSNQIYWNDTISKKFNENIVLEKITVKETVDELKNIKNIYEELIYKYEKIGNKIEIFPKSKDNILSKIDNYLDKLHQILKLYNEISNNKNLKEILIINNHILKLKNMEKDISLIKKNIKEKYELIEEIEKNIDLMISRIKIEYINEIDINEFV